MARTKQTGGKTIPGESASGSDYSSAWLREGSLTSFNDFPQLRQQKEKVDYEESESESESEGEDDEVDDHEQHRQEEAEEEDEVEIKPDEDDSLFVGQNERQNTRAQEDAEDSPLSSVGTPTPPPAPRSDTQARASVTSQVSAPSTNNRYTKPSRVPGSYSHVLVKEHAAVKKHLVKYIDSEEAAKVAHEDRFNALWRQRDIKLLERERMDIPTSRKHSDDRSKRNEEEEAKWIRSQKQFTPYLKGGSQKSGDFGKHMNTAKDLHEEHSDEDDEEPLPAKPEEQEDDEMPDYTETRTELNADNAPAKRTWQVQGGQMVAWPPFEDDADPDRWRPRQRTGHWATQEVVPAEAEKSRSNGECSIM